jgi:hypothetical protein
MADGGKGRAIVTRDNVVGAPPALVWYTLLIATAAFLSNRGAFMRRSIAVTLIGLLAATPVGAQFEGTVTMKMSSKEGSNEDMTVKMAMKGGKTVTMMTMPASAGPMGGGEMRSIFDPSAHTSTILMPIPPEMASVPQLANAKGIKMVMDLSKARPQGAGDAGNVDIKKLGTSETIAGMSCDDYEVTDKKETTRMCLTESLGSFMFPQTGGIGGRGRGASAPAWSKVFGNKPMFPLKVWTPDGKMAMEVVSVDKSSVPSSLFDIPDGYMDMSAMMGGFRPPL